MAEYVKFSPEEVSYSKKNLLYSEMEILNSIKHLSDYKKLRNHELILKIDLKKKVDEINTSIAILQKILPKTDFKEIKRREESENYELENSLKDIIEDKKTLSVEQELDEIRRKLQSLQ